MTTFTRYISSLEYEIYQGDDRHRQINAIKEIAGDIRFGAAGEGTPEEQVQWYLGQLELPEWFDDHDRSLLLRFVSEDENKDWITLPQASRRFDIPLPTLRYHAKKGSSFAAYKPDKRTWLCEAGSVEEWVEGRRKT